MGQRDQSLENEIDLEMRFKIKDVLLRSVAIDAVEPGKPVDTFGRKKVLFIMGTMYFISAIVSALAFNWIFFVIMRFTRGLAVGGSYLVASMYNAEISGNLIFSFYAFCMALQLVRILFIMPETRGIPVEELQKKWRL